MALRSYAARTFKARTFTPVWRADSSGPAPVLSPVMVLRLPDRAYAGSLAARAFQLVLVARTPSLTLPARSFTLGLSARGRGGGVALTLENKQPSETFLVQIFAEEYLPPGRTIAACELYASRKTATLSAALAASSVADATSIQMTQHPGVGARLIINQAGATAELVKADAVSGSGPYTVTVFPSLMFAHLNGEAIDYEPGFSTGVLVSTVPTIANGDEIFPHLTRGVSGHTYRISMVMTLDNGDIIEAEFDMPVLDI